MPFPWESRLSGIFEPKYKERPFDPKSKEEIKEDYRVVWVIVTEKDETTHLRLSGPAVSVRGAASRAGTGIVVIQSVEKPSGGQSKWVCNRSAP